MLRLSLCHKYADDAVVKMMDTSLRPLQLESEREESLLMYPAINIPYLTITWMTRIKDILGAHNLQVETSIAWTPTRMRERLNDHELPGIQGSLSLSIATHQRMSHVFIGFLSGRHRYSRWVENLSLYT